MIYLDSSVALAHLLVKIGSRPLADRKRARPHRDQRNAAGADIAANELAIRRTLEAAGVELIDENGRGLGRSSA